MGGRRQVMDTQQQPSVSVRALEKRFAGVLALDGINLDFYPGEVHCVCGENGAGKSTLVKIIAGVYPKDGGEVFYDGHKADVVDTRQARELGTAIIFQEPGIVSSLTVAENIFLNDEAQFQIGGVLNLWGRGKAARAALHNVGCDRIDVDTRVSDLPYEDWKIVELARAVATKDLRVFVVDEATAALGQDGHDMLFAQIHRLRAAGVAILYISHHLKEVVELGDRITVMKDGRLVTTMSAAECKLEELPALMVGRNVDEYYSRTDNVPASTDGEPVLKIVHLSIPKQIHDVSFDLHAGELLGVAGLVGSGMHALGRAIFGAIPFTGQIIVRGEVHTSMTPRRAIQLGMGFVPRERDKEALVLYHSLVDNVALPNIDHLTLPGTGKLIVSGKQKVELTERYRKSLAIKTNSVKTICNSLSGGNRQKVVLAKWLARNVSILVMACPTRGIDVGAKAEIYALLEKLRESGVAIIMISEELPELLGMSDRILVIKDGRLEAVLSRDTKPTEELIASKMM